MLKDDTDAKSRGYVPADTKGNGDIKWVKTNAKKVEIDLSMFSVGDKINKCCGHGVAPYGGIIVKITASRLHIQMYERKYVSHHCESWIGLNNDVEDYGYDLYTWDTGIKGKKIIVTSNGITKVDNFEVKQSFDNDR